MERKERKECMVCNYRNRKGDDDDVCPCCGSSHYCLRSERTEYDKILFGSYEFKNAHKRAVDKGVDPEPIFNQLRDILSRDSFVLVKTTEYGEGVEYTYTLGKVEGDWGGHFEKTSPSAVFFFCHREGRAKQRIDIYPADLVFHMLEKYQNGFKIFETNEVPKERIPDLSSWNPGRSKMAEAKSKQSERQAEYRKMCERLATKGAEARETETDEKEEKRRVDREAREDGERKRAAWVAERAKQVADARRRLEEAFGESVDELSNTEVLKLVAEL